jgi:hypothetical protein
LDYKRRIMVGERAIPYLVEEHLSFDEDHMMLLHLPQYLHPFLGSPERAHHL